MSTQDRLMQYLEPWTRVTEAMTDEAHKRLIDEITMVSTAFRAGAIAMAEESAGGAPLGRVERLTQHIIDSKFDFYWCTKIPGLTPDSLEFPFKGTVRELNEHLAKLTVDFAIELDRLLTQHEKRA